MREHCSIWKNLQAHPRIGIFCSGGQDEDKVTEVDEEGNDRNAALWSLCRSVFREEVCLGGELLPYKVLVLLLPRSFGQCGHVLLTCCRALRFVLRRMGEFTARRMARLLQLIVDSLMPFCIYIYCIHACSTPCVWEVVSHRYSPRVWIINLDPPP